jgi:Pyruvate/2-oxoacid:ferredoxin oxidoreductase delta subunit
LREVIEMARGSVRDIIKIDEEKCNGCGLCVPSCAEGAIQVIDGKARLISEVYCDGLGACLGECPEGALEIVQREVEEFDEEAVKAHLESSATGSVPGVAGSRHAGHVGSSAAAAGTEEDRRAKEETEQGGPDPSSFQGCPGSRVMQFERKAQSRPPAAGRRESALRHWPVQLMLVPVDAPYFQGADLLVVADCVPFASAGFHEELLRGRALVVGCPKLDDIGHYTEKLAEIFRRSDVRSVTVATMEVPCCSGLLAAVGRAIKVSGQDIPLSSVVVGVRGESTRQDAPARRAS